MKPIEVGRVETIFRYPVKSMGGERLEVATLGWHGLDPDPARPAPEVLKAIVRVRDNKAGVYGTVTRCGRLAVGQPVFVEPRS
jgi:hypothetical protein